jgi:hypothetical protein
VSVVGRQIDETRRGVRAHRDFLPRSVPLQSFVASGRSLHGKLLSIGDLEVGEAA